MPVRAIAAVVRSAAGRILDLLFPGRCLVCGESLLDVPAGSYAVCRACLGNLPVIAGARCRVCGGSLISERGICTECRNRAFHFDSHRSICTYSGVARELLYQYKFRGRFRLARLIADLMAEQLGKSHAGLPVVPVPGRQSSARRRGWEHVDLICRHLARRHRIAVLRALRRTGGKPQKSLNFEKRLANLRNRIVFRAGAAAGAGSSSVVLIDDVYTTGATADECARVLRSAGLKHIYVLTFAQDV